MSKYIAFFVGFSVLISLIYIAGYKKNIKLMKGIAEALEGALKPKDKLYTYLGGVLGFAVDYAVDGFKKVHVTLRLIPRQSALYLPFMFITSGKDSLQIMFYTHKPVKSEFHILKKGLLKLTEPKIYNRKKLKSEIIEIEGRKYEMLYENDDYREFVEFVKLFDLKHFNHLAITAENSIVYVNLLFYGLNPEKFEESLKKAVKYLKKRF